MPVVNAAWRTEVIIALGKYVEQLLWRKQLCWKLSRKLPC